MRPGLKQPRNTAEARAIQKALRERIRLEPLRKSPELIAGADAAFSGEMVVAVACLFTFPELELIDEKTVIRKVTFPYIPGFLTFREGPAVIEAVRKLGQRPDLLLIDGQGIAHPERIGIASHVGLVLDIPTIGCAKSRLVGEYEEPGLKKGNWSELKYKQERVGTVLRTRDRVSAMFISPGHRVSFEDSVRIALSTVRSSRVPEPTRVADVKTKKMKREYEAQRIHRSDL
ncbi:MAG: deoxyribonuclease V [Nitrospiraceae bacterium]|nr:deoxyribonuclease V [Nitrospiraceae bacterium]